MRGPNLYDADLQRNVDAANKVAQHLRGMGMPQYDAEVLAILGGLPMTNGGALEQATQGARGGQLPGFDALRQMALTNGGTTLGSCIVNSALTVEEAYARLAALGDPNSPQPIAFHVPRTNCPHRAHLMIEVLLQLGLSPEKAWAISRDPHVNTRNQTLRLCPVTREGQPLADARGQIQWPNHVAPVVEIMSQMGKVWIVLDPSLMRGPATLAEWHGRVNPAGNHSQQVTPLGVAATDPTTQVLFPGTGFHAANAPEPVNPTLASQQAMQAAFQRTPLVGGLLWFDPKF